MSTIRATAKIRVSPENVEKFARMTSEIIALVREKEEGRTLTYAYYARNAEATECLVHEAYADNFAFSNHMENLAPIMESYGGVYFEIEQLDICGDLIPELQETVTHAFPGVMTTYSHTLGTL